MSEGQVRLIFQPHGRNIFALPGTKLLEAAARAGLAFDTPCGGQGTCGKCRVRIVSGACEPTDNEKVIFDDAELAEGWRLACQTTVYDAAVVDVPESSLFASGHKILTSGDTGEAPEIAAAVRKIYVELPEPSLDSCAADLERLQDALGPIKADLGVLRRLPSQLRKGGFKGTAVLTDHRLIDFEEGDTTEHCYGIAFDIGTTTVVGVLMNLRDGKELAIASRINPQVSFGDDVLSRIQHASSPGSLNELNKAIIEAVAEMIDQLCADADVKSANVYEIAFAGNTTMEHLLCGLGVEQLGYVPFVPTFARGLLLSARQLGIPIASRCAAYVFPVIGGFVGGDTVAGMLATQLDVADDGPTLMIDIGTNGEIVLAHDGRIWAASTAAGPAFEGARISCGMRATRGAIEKVVCDGDLQLSVIGNVEPMGLCGSGLIDLAAGLLDCGVISSVGRMLPPEELPADLPEPIRNRIVADDNVGVELVLSDDGGSRRVTLTQRDVRELQLATGAIRAGMNILIRQAGLQAGDLKRVLIAGGFGSFIRRSLAQRIGLLPAGIDHQRIHYVGNASLNGAKWALLSTVARKQAENLARKTIHVELSQDPNFQMEFADAMIFPDK